MGSRPTRPSRTREAVEARDREDVAGLGARPEAPLAQRAEEVGEVGLAEARGARTPRASAKADELAEVALVGEERGVGQAALDAQVVEPGAFERPGRRSLSSAHQPLRATMRQRTSASPTRSARVSRT